METEYTISWAPLHSINDTFYCTKIFNIFFGSFKKNFDTKQKGSQMSHRLHHIDSMNIISNRDDWISWISFQTMAWQIFVLNHSHVKTWEIYTTKKRIWFFPTNFFRYNTQSQLNPIDLLNNKIVKVISKLLPEQFLSLWWI